MINDNCISERKKKERRKKGLVEIELKTESTSDVSGQVDIYRRAEN